MGGYVTRQSYEWVYTDQPHLDRRKEMLRQYPQIKRFMRGDPHFKWVVCAQIAAQIVACYAIKDLTWFWIVICAYVFGGTMNHTLTLAIHELTHNIAFGFGKHRKWNMAFAILANLPFFFPYCVSFKKYHSDHHKQLGVDGIDTDIPTEWEAQLFKSPLRKFVYLLIHPVFYVFRPVWVNPKPLNLLDIINGLCCATFGVILYSAWGVRPLVYLGLSSFLGLAIHPISGHFIAEHYMFAKGHETYSYYGPFNSFAYNAGLHMEHHDFPNIPGSKLPLLRKIAPNFYDDLPQYYSWIGVWKKFVTDKSIGPYSRVIRKPATSK